MVRLSVTPALFVTSVFGVSALAGTLGAFFGIGGGMLIIPALTLLFGVDIHFAAGASAVAIIATSCGAAASYVRDRLTNVRVAMFLELGSVVGSFLGAYGAGTMPSRTLYLLFGSVVAAAALSSLQSQTATPSNPPPSPFADRLRLHGSYLDAASGAMVQYQVGRPVWGLLLTVLAGAMNGLLGIGGGALKVPAMERMGMPLKAATATSNFMIGVTAAAGASVYLSRGYIQPQIAGPVAAGVLAGAFFGARAMNRFPTHRLRLLFSAVLLMLAVQMFLRGSL